MEPQRIHLAFLGENPGPTHTRLYTEFPVARGFSSNVADEARFEATFVAGLAQVFEDGGGLQPCFLLLPASQTVWGTAQMTQIVRRMLSRWKHESDPAIRARAVHRLAEGIKHMMVGSRVLQLDNPPSRWVAFGFTVNDPVPEWLRDGLILV